MPRKAIKGIAIALASYAVLLFVPAWTLDWWRAWVFLGTMTLATLGTFGWLSIYNPALLQERLGPLIQAGQPLADRVILLLFVVLHLAWIAFIPLDVFHWHLLPRPDVAISSLGLCLYLFGSWLVFQALHDNTFAIPVVKYQESRAHHVVNTGLYAVVRHPMYAGFLPLIVGTSLWLESYAGVLVGLLSLGALVARIRLEEAFLREKLPGYDAYTRKVRYRLIPFVW